MEDSARRVPVSAAITAAQAALTAPAADDPEDLTAPLAAIPAPRSGEEMPSAGDTIAPRSSVAPPGVRRPAAGRPALFRGAARSLFVTPWFAAATGFVIAAGLWVYSPHTVLRFPNSSPGVSLCRSAGCVQEPKVGPHEANAGPGVQIPRQKAKTEHPAKSAVNHLSTAANGLVFKFTVLWHRHHGFGATIAVTGHHVPSSWRLSFDLPSAQIEYVMGVTWQANAAGTGGTASQATWQSNGPGAGDGSGGGGLSLDGNGSGGVQAAPDGVPVITFLITGNGPATAPVHCVFDGASCTFR